MTETEALLILNAVAGLTTLQVKRLLAAFGSAERVLNAPPKDLENVAQLSALAAEKIFKFDRDGFLRKEEEHISRHGVSIVTLQDSAYPACLKNIPDPPVVLYIKGKLPSESEPAIAIVGSRQATRYGHRTAETISRQLAALGITVISGLARGIDTCAHEGCLAAGGKTIAVLGCGLCHVYPPENKKLLARIALTGAVISEFAMPTEPMPYFFPRRNRIISGLALGVLVVEAAKKSGALITARTALEQGKDVFAIPGKVDEPSSEGTNQLIKEGAKLITTAHDVVEGLAGELRRTVETVVAPQQKPDSLSLTEEETKIYMALNSQPVYIDDLASSAVMPIPQLMDILLKLEIKHYINRLPGRYFVRA